jgi:hypothetical protein
MTLKEYSKWEKQVSVLTRDERHEARVRWNLICENSSIEWHTYLLRIAQKKEKVLTDIFNNDPLNLL